MASRRASLKARPASDGRIAQPRELTLEQADLCDVTADVVVAASLAHSESEPAAHVHSAHAASAQVNDSGEVLALLQRGGRDVIALERSYDRAIEQRCGHFHCIAGHHARVERVE